MGRVSTRQKNCKTIDLRGAQVNNTWCFSTPANRLLFQKFAQANNKENIKAQIKWSFVRGIHRWLDCCVAKTSQPVASHTILNTNGHIWTNVFITAFNNTNMTVLRKYITSQWRYMRDMVSQITGNSTVVFRLNKGDIRAQHYWPFVSRIHRYLIIIIIIDLRTAQVYCDPIFFGQPGSVSKFPPFLCVKLWVGWVGRGYIEISRYFCGLIGLLSSQR